MKVLFYISAFLISINGFSQENEEGMIFHSSKEFNEYRFGNTNLHTLTSGYLLDMEEEWTTAELDSFVLAQQNDTSNIDGLLNFFNLLERTDVNYQFERDSILFLIMDRYISIEREKEVMLPLYVMDVDFSRLNSQQRNSIENWTNLQAYGAFSAANFQLQNFFYTSLFIDTLEHDLSQIYWDENTYISNTSRTISALEIQIGNELITLSAGIPFDLATYLENYSIDNIGIIVHFSDGTTQQKVCKVHLEKAPKDNDIIPKGYGVYQDEYGNDTHKVTWSVFYGCEDSEENLLNKPFIFVAGWGSYTDKWLINWSQGWPTHENQLYQQYNQDNIITELREYGYDVVIVRFTPPNASVQSNADKLKYVINWVNQQKTLANSQEENIILGYSAGSLCVRLTLEQMEKEHLENNGPHPHTKLYVSYDGEHGGANIPLAAQHAVKYLNTYQSGLFTFKIYALNYILNAPLSKELLRYFWEQTGSLGEPGQGAHGSRWELLQKFQDANHSKTSPERPGYPSFSRIISISNGMNESQYAGNGVNHFPYPSSFGHIPFSQSNVNRKWVTQFNSPGGNIVFLYKKRFWPFGWSIQMEGKTGTDCLVLDNAPGGMVFINTNPLTEVMKQMKAKIGINDPQVYFPHAQFCFTPTLFTHDIRNFDAASNGYKMAYSMKQKLLMFQSKEDYDLFVLDPESDTLSSDYFGYPHIAYPYSHYWEATPFDAVFSANYNTEHILFNNCTRSDPNNNNEAWQRLDDPSTTVVKNFILDEADYFNAYIQNKQYGWNARADYTYTADIIEPNAIFVGKEVTQRTDFKEVEFRSNSKIKLQAGKEIVLSPGTNVLAGADFHAYIASYPCDYFKSGISTSGSSQSNQQSTRMEVATMATVSEIEENPFTIYPNPSDGIVTIRNDSEKGHNFEYVIYNLSGIELTRGESRNTLTSFQVATGVYIVKINNYEKSYSYKVIVH